jgi:short-subunit dehydrogenase
MNVHGKRVVITGASRGIGKALAEGMAKSGASLWLTGLEADELAAVTEDLTRKYQADVAFMPADLTDPGQLQTVLARLAEDDRPIDILVNNAGAGEFERFVSAPWERLERSVRLNVLAPTCLIHGLLPQLLTRPEAAIVNISSAIARLPYPGFAVYGAGKGFVSSLSESLATELADTNVRVICVHPGFTATQFITSAHMDMRRIPGIAVKTPDAVALRVLRAIIHETPWAFGDPMTRLGVTFAGWMPRRLKMKLFSRLFWRLPDAA